MESELTFSVVIPAWPDEQRPYGLDYIDKVDWPIDHIEVIIAHGLDPNEQRTEAALVAKGDILVFFDNDSCPEPDYFKLLEKHYSDPNIGGVCGPNPGIKTKALVPDLVEAIFRSPFAVFSKYARYKSTGSLRECSDSDVIFCNFTIRRKLYMDLGGINPQIWPNEENEFLDRCRSEYPEQKILYDPVLIAREPRPDSLISFANKMHNYGQGRARRFKISPNLWSFIHLLGCLIPLIILVVFFKWGVVSLLIISLPYLLLVSTASVYNYVINKNLTISLLVPIGIVITHFAYVLGLWKGLLKFNNKKRNHEEPVGFEYYLGPLD